MPQSYPLILIFKGFVYMFSYFYSFDTVLSIFAFNEACNEEFTAVSSLIFVLRKLLLKNSPLFLDLVICCNNPKTLSLFILNWRLFLL